MNILSQKVLEAKDEAIIGIAVDGAMRKRAIFHFGQLNLLGIMLLLPINDTGLGYAQNYVKQFKMKRNGSFWLVCLIRKFVGRRIRS